jgi:hypothetical protein
VLRQIQLGPSRSPPAKGRGPGLRGGVAVVGCSTKPRSSSSASFCPLCFTCKTPLFGEPTSGLEPLTCSLRVITQALQGCAGGCRTRIPRPDSLLRVAECCTVLRSRWYQIGIRTSDSYSPTAGPMASPRDLRSHNPPTPVSRAFPALQIADGRSRRELDRRTAQHCLLGLATQRRSRVASRIPSFEKVVLRRSRR